MSPHADLPVHEIEADIVASLRAGNRLVVRAPTASGKSTGIPQMLVDHDLVGDRERVVVLQPRRIAARMLAAFVAGRRRVRLGEEVGYQIRFEDRTSAATRIQYVTEGILLRRLIGDPGLRGVGAVVFDEFHERHLYGDISLARALDLQDGARPDLKIVVMSATLDVTPLERYLQPSRTVTSEGRTYPVEIEYLARAAPQREGVWESAAREVDRLLRRDDASGDVLVFMPGAFEIHRTIRELERNGVASSCAVLPLHGELDTAQQDLAVGAAARRKVIVSTNVAETSLTIEGVTAVVDSGLARKPRYDPHRGIDTLLVERISRASADQRAGRAGRTAPGRCVRLWTEREQAERRPADDPEIRCVDLAEVALTLKAAGVPDLRAFRWLDAPDEKTLVRAEELLIDLGALGPGAGEITGLGQRMLAFPLHPRYARMLIEGGRRGCVRAVALIAALTQGRDLLVRRQNRDVRDRRDDLLGDQDSSDFFRLMQAWQYAAHHRFQTSRCREMGIHAATARQVGKLFESFVRTAEREGLPTEGPSPSDEAIRRCVLAGFADHLARRVDAGTLRCEIVHGRKGDLDRESSVRDHELFVAAEIHEIEGRDVRIVLSLATAVEESWLRDLDPAGFRETDETFYDATARRVRNERRRVFRDLVLARRETDPDAERAAKLLAREIEKGHLVLKRWKPATDQWIDRLNFLAEHCADLGFTSVTPEDRQTMVEQVCLGAVSYKEIKDRPVDPVVKGWIDPSLQPLVDRYAPPQLELPNGKRAKVAYTPGAAPKVSKRIEDLYDLRETPRVAEGRVPVVVEILGPNFRPVQTTRDLDGFWRETYPGIKKELQRKYPRHEWR